MKYSLKFSRGDSEELKEYLLQPFSSRKDCQAAARCCALLRSGVPGRSEEWLTSGALLVALLRFSHSTFQQIDTSTRGSSG